MSHRQKSFGVQLISLNDTDFLESVIMAFQPFVDKIVVSLNSKSWFGNIPNNGKVEKLTNKIVEKFDNVQLLKGDWNKEEEQRNETLKAMPECDYIFIVDADELWSSESIHNIQDYVLSPVGKSYTVFNAFWNTRFKDMNLRVEPREPFKPTILIKNKVGIEFHKNRLIKTSINSSTKLIPEKIAIIEHFSYLRINDLQIKEKLKTFSHANEILNGVDFYYENVYLQADMNSTNFHPTHPEAYASLIFDEVHPEIITSLKKYSPKLFEKKNEDSD